jgi:hypothetical protein
MLEGSVLTRTLFRASASPGPVKRVIRIRFYFIGKEFLL